MKILIGNHFLARTGGTENYSFALALELKRQGHDVEYFTFEKGEVSALLESEGVSYMSSDYYDVILANHNTVIEALWTYGFIVQTCHGTIPQLEQPSPFADAYVSVSGEVRDHLKKLGYDSVVIPNGIDCKRFCPSVEVSQSLTSVLSLCQSDVANEFIRKCCEKTGLRFVQSNKYKENTWSLEDIINKCDVVVGLGRSAYDAMACGRCVVCYDFRDYMGEFLGEGMLSPENIEESMYCNCSGRVKRLKYDEDTFIAELRKFSPDLARWSRKYVEENLNIELAAKRYLSIREELEFGREYKRLKGRLNALSKSLYQGFFDASAEKVSMQKSYQHKCRKHLRAIRFLLWSLIMAAVAIVGLACKIWLE